MRTVSEMALPLQTINYSMPRDNADLSSFRVLGAEDLRAPLALSYLLNPENRAHQRVEDRNLLPEILVNSSLSGPLGTRISWPLGAQWINRFGYERSLSHDRFNIH
ncbi:hypothetical protein TNCV_3629471 [Trichonephila clavipes]|nr:hypothetical protein TNCV_3629471 [Trichonephila clavipes]